MPDSDGELQIDVEKALRYTAGDPDLLKSAAELAEVEATEQMGLIEHALQRSACEEISSAAHRLRGSIAIFGAQSVTDAVLRLEQTANSKQLGDVQQAWQTVKLDMQRFFNELRLL